MNPQEISQRIEKIFENSKFSITHLCQLTILCRFEKGTHKRAFGIFLEPGLNVESEIVKKLREKAF